MMLGHPSRGNQPLGPAAPAAHLNKSVNGSGQVFGFSTSTPSFTVLGCSTSFPSARPVTSGVLQKGYLCAEPFGDCRNIAYPLQFRPPAH